MTLFRKFLSVLAASASFVCAGTASAAICTGPGGGPNLVYGSIPEASACSGMSPGNLVEGALGAFGENWVFLDKGESPGDPFDGALTITFDDPTTRLSGTWTINLAGLLGQFDTFVLGLKPDGGFGYFLVGSTLDRNVEHGFGQHRALPHPKQLRRIRLVSHERLRAPLGRADCPGTGNARTARDRSTWRRVIASAPPVLIAARRSARRETRFGGSFV